MWRTLWLPPDVPGNQVSWSWPRTHLDVWLEHRPAGAAVEHLERPAGTKTGHVSQNLNPVGWRCWRGSAADSYHRPWMVQLLMLGGIWHSFSWSKDCRQTDDSICYQTCQQILNWLPLLAASSVPFLSYLLPRFPSLFLYFLLSSFLFYSSPYFFTSLFTSILLLYFPFLTASSFPSLSACFLAYLIFYFLTFLFPILIKSFLSFPLSSCPSLFPQM